ncbi:Tyrosine recombinase XerC [compost metagenome]
MALVWPRGIELNGRQIRISFMYEGKRYKEPIGNETVDQASIKYAEAKRNTILSEIKNNRFNYAAHFPNSRRVLPKKDEKSKRTVAQGVERYLEVQMARHATTTGKNYAYKAKHLLDKFGSDCIADICRSDLQLFQTGLLKTLSPKSVNDVFTIVRGVWDDAHSDGVISINPCKMIKNIKQDKDDDSADPFTRDEMEKISVIREPRAQDVNMILFNCWTGLSVSELIALCWDDVDLETGTIYVRAARVEGEYKVPKESVRARKIELIDPALEYLKKHWEFTGHLPPVALEITQRDNNTTRLMHLKLVFRNSVSMKPWYGNSLNRWFTSHLKNVGVRHRGVNQCRHTFASQAISSYVPLEWIARQLGHTDTTMVKKHYGRFLPSETRSMAAMVSQMMGFRDKPEAA